MKIETGQIAPEFSLFTSDKKKLSLSELRGQNVVLLFFPLAFTGVCTKELCNVRDNIAFYNHIKAKVLGISVDSLYTLARFRDEQHLNFPLLSDFNKEVSELYGCLYETFGYEMRGVSKRAAFVINKEGVVEYAEVLENAGLLPDFNEIQRTLISLN